MFYNSGGTSTLILALILLGRRLFAYQNTSIAHVKNVEWKTTKKASMWPVLSSPSVYVAKCLVCEPHTEHRPVKIPKYL